ncbi:MAG: cohesin domain-containing protein [Candidatus Marinimicrobia bacterium]|nr:cohesin domain-containing protein [Candidatus Neomarinimicrobiota bacterium]
MKTILTIGVLLFAITPVFAQYDFVWVKDGYELTSTSHRIGIVLSSETEISGIQFALRFNSTNVEVDTIRAVNRLNGFSIFYNESSPGNVIVMAASLSGNAISAGTEEVLEIDMTEICPVYAAVPLEITDLVLSDKNGNQIHSASGDGYLFPDNCSAIRIRNGRSKLPVDLYSKSALGGIQFAFSYDASALTFDSVKAGSRIQTMTVSYAENSPGKVIMLIYSPAGDSISAGHGTILDICFSETATPIATQSILLTNSILSDPKGNVVNAEFLDGKYFIPMEWVRIAPERIDIPVEVALHQNFPNPFNSSTTISYQIPRDETVSLSIYDIAGKLVQKIVAGRQIAGSYSIYWNANDVPSGIYLIRLTVGGITQMRKCLLVK